ncbi:MAG: hypothetical protein SOX84_01365 [Prevotella sp.]|nr:hypothetical protein [Prevotella sp.]
MKYLFYSAAIALTGLLTACSQSDELVDDKTIPGTEEVKGKTTFGGFQTNQGEKRNAPVRRTSLDHTKVGVASNPFFWELNDNLWVKNGEKLQKSSSSDITSPKTPYARFYFDGVFEDTTYPVYYRGNNETTSNTVVIATQQKQEAANSSKHFGASGDCGTATAKRNGSGIYEFTLQHKAAYLSIVPRMTDTSLGANTHLTQVKIVSNNTIAGTYDFSSGSLTGVTPTNESKEITVTCGGNDGFPLTGSSAADALAKTGVYAVIAPGNHTLRLEYTITDKSRNVTGIVYQYLKANNFAENTLTDIVVDLNTRIIDIESFKYYRWDAKKEIFDGQATHPHLSDQQGTFIVNDDTKSNRTGDFSSAVNSLKDAPNINEAIWYVKNGEPMIEEGVLYKLNGHLYLGKGLWLKKKAYIENFSKEQAPDGQNYRTKTPSSQTSVTCTKGRPADPSKYFFLPAKGGVLPNGTAEQPEEQATKGTMSDVTQEGYYWTSTASTDGRIYVLHFLNDKCNIYHSGILALPRYGMTAWIGE